MKESLTLDFISYRGVAIVVAVYDDDDDDDDDD